MKVKIVNTVKCASRGITFYKGKTYKASVATNLPGYARFVQKKSNLQINKLFVSKGKGRPDIDTMLIEKEDFEIVEFPKKERAEIFEQYKNSKIKTPRVKRVVPLGKILRHGFRLMDAKELKNKKLIICMMGTAKDGRCTKLSQFVRVNDFNTNTKTACCGKHAVV